MNRRSITPALTLVATGAAAIAAGLLVGAVLEPSDDTATRVAAAALRLAVFGLGTWAVVVGALGLLAAVLGWGAAARAALRLGGARWGLAVGLGAAVASTGPAGAATAPDTSPAPETSMPVAQFVPVGVHEATLTPLALEVDVDTGEARLVPVEETGEPTDGHPTEGTAGLLADDLWLVEQGDHLWSIAERVVLAGAPDADDDAVTAYWLRLIDANRGRLLVPSEPDLIVPGQRLLLPPVAG